MPEYEALTICDKATIRLLFEDFAGNMLKRESEKRALHDIRLRLSYFLCNIIDKYRVVEGITNAAALTVVDIYPEDEDLIEDLLTLFKYKYAGDLKDERLFLNIVYRRFDNLVLKYY